MPWLSAIDWDDALAYSTEMKVKVRHRTVGAIYYSIMLLILIIRIIIVIVVVIIMITSKPQKP